MDGGDDYCNVAIDLFLNKFKIFDYRNKFLQFKALRNNFVFNGKNL